MSETMSDEISAVIDLTHLSDNDDGNRPKRQRNDSSIKSDFSLDDDAALPAVAGAVREECLIHFNDIEMPTDGIILL